MQQRRPLTQLNLPLAIAALCLGSVACLDPESASSVKYGAGVSSGLESDASESESASGESGSGWSGGSDEAGDGDGDANEAGDGETSTTDAAPEDGSGESQGGDGDGDGSGSDGGDDTSSSGTPPAGDSGSGGSACVETTLHLETLPPEMIFVLDYSGSMTSPMGSGESPPTRWEALHGVVSSLGWELQDRINWGLKIFPTPLGEDSCSVESNLELFPMASAGSMLSWSLPAPDSIPSGTTPLGQGLDVAYDYLEWSAEPGGKAVLLVADGGTSGTCSSVDQVAEVLTRVETANAAGVGTYVVGIDPNWSTQDELEAIALAGGDLKQSPGEAYWTAASQAELGQALEDAAMSAISCDLPVEVVPALIAETEVRVDGFDFQEIADCQSEHGWQLDADGYENTLTLCGTACDLARQSGEVELTFLCKAH